MAPKTKFTKEEIINAAFNIAKEEGLDAITIRKVAAQLGSSIAPIYVNFNNVQELHEAVVEKTLDVSKQYMLEQNSGHPFRDIGIASLKFAKDYSVLYRDLIMKNNPHMKHSDENAAMVVEQMRKEPAAADFTDDQLKDLLLKMAIFQTGLCVMAANDLLPESLNDEQMIGMLDDVAESLYVKMKMGEQEK